MAYKLFQLIQQWLAVRRKSKSLVFAQSHKVGRLSWSSGYPGSLKK